jgi:23S rRNA pseudouridine1911/1915/1917 synthase
MPVTTEDNNNQIDAEIVASPPAEEDGAQQVVLVIKRLLPDRRIDKYLRHRFPDFSRNVIQRLIEEEAVTVNGRPTKSSYHLNPRDRIDIILPPPPTNEIPPEPIPLNVIYEDEHMLVINKQANLLVHPARGNPSGTLVNGLVYYSSSLSTINGQFRPGIVHRLDRNTTGVMVVAKTDTAHWRLAHQFEHRLVQKTYLAIVQGTMELDADVIDVPIGRHPRVREKYAARPESGKPAVTTYHVQHQYRGYALLSLLPKTGRTHQLRVHLSMIKHPIAGDTMYGGSTVTLAQLANGQSLPRPGQPGGDLGPDDIIIDRQALHAAQLQIHHPVSGQPLTLDAPPPPDLQLLLTLLDRYRR